MASSVGNSARQLVRQLLIHNQLQRLGCRSGGARDVAGHEWFDGFDFDGLVEKKLSPPYIPTVKSQLDTSNFDPYDMVPAPQTPHAPQAPHAHAPQTPHAPR